MARDAAARVEHRAIAAATGISRDEDFVDAEREDPACIVAMTVAAPFDCSRDTAERLAAAISRSQWSGRASQLSEDHVEWSFIDEIARATQDEGRDRSKGSEKYERSEGSERSEGCRGPRGPRGVRVVARQADRCARAAPAAPERDRVRGRSTIGRAAFVGMLSRVLAGRGRRGPVSGGRRAFIWPCSSTGWTTFRQGCTCCCAIPDALNQLRGAPPQTSCGNPPTNNCRSGASQRAIRDRSPHVFSCDQDIAADGFFSLGMLADFDASLAAFGPSFYRNLFWETGMVGQVLYLEAEAAGARATGIGCFFDDPVHDVLGLRGHAFQACTTSRSACRSKTRA